MTTVPTHTTIAAARGSAPGRGFAAPGASREEIARNFESLFLKKLVEELRVSAGGDEGLFGSGPGSAMQEDWFDQIFADHLAASGKFGFAKMLPKETPR